MNTENLSAMEKRASTIIPVADAEAAQSLIHLEELTKVYRSDSVETTALNHINIDISRVSSWP